jgi:hypothetical protein
MKPFTYLSLVFAVFACTTAVAQKTIPTAVVRELTIEPGVGIHTNFWNRSSNDQSGSMEPNQALCLAAHTSLNFNNILQRDVNYVKTNYTIRSIKSLEPVRLFIRKKVRIRFC